jgi:hypothetical protein
VIAISAGEAHIAALPYNDIVVASGASPSAGGPLDYHQTVVPPGVSDVTVLDSGGEALIAEGSDGTIIAWCSNPQVAVPATADYLDDSVNVTGSVNTDATGTFHAPIRMSLIIKSRNLGTFSSRRQGRLSC